MTQDITRADAHRPTEAFRDYLEGEVSRSFRRDRTLRRMRMAAVIMVSVALGTTGGLASAQIREGAQRDSLLEAAQADATLASVRLALAQVQLADERKLVAVGARSPESVASAEMHVRDMQAQAGRAALNIEEIMKTATAPRDELNAPLVGGRDFVKDRIQLKLASAQQQLQSAERNREEIARRVRVGVVGELAGVEAELAVAKAQREMVVLVERLALRREFLEKATPVEVLMNRLEQAEIRQDIGVARRALDIARERVGLLESRQSVGAASELDVMKARVEVKEREIDIRRLNVRLGTLARP